MVQHGHKWQFTYTSENGINDHHGELYVVVGMVDTQSSRLVQIFDEFRFLVRCWQRGESVYCRLNIQERLIEAYMQTINHLPPSEGKDLQEICVNIIEKEESALYPAFYIEAIGEWEDRVPEVVSTPAPLLRHNSFEMDLYSTSNFHGDRADAWFATKFDLDSTTNDLTSFFSQPFGALSNSSATMVTHFFPDNASRFPKAEEITYKEEWDQSKEDIQVVFPSNQGTLMAPGIVEQRAWLKTGIEPLGIHYVPDEAKIRFNLKDDLIISPHAAYRVEKLIIDPPVSGHGGS